MTPASGSFAALGCFSIVCPECEQLIDIRDVDSAFGNWGPSLRDLIGIASEHARLSHPVSVAPATIAP